MFCGLGYVLCGHSGVIELGKCLMVYMNCNDIAYSSCDVVMDYSPALNRGVLYYGYSKTDSRKVRSDWPLLLW